MLNKLTNKKNLAEYLLKENILSKDLYDRLKKADLDLDSFIIDNKILDEEAFVKVKAKYFNVPCTDLVGKKIDFNFLKIISQEVAENYKIISFNKEGSDISVGITDVNNFKAIEAVEFLAKEGGFKIKYFLISQNSFKEAIKQYKNLKKEVTKLLDIAEEERNKEEKENEKQEKMEIAEVIKGAPVSKMVSVILRHAVEGEASDIHIEPMGDNTRVRYRIDGMLGTSLILPAYIHSSVVARIKILSNLKIDESRIPQDGRMRLIIDNRTIDFRISTMPLVGKEKVVMRILDTSGKSFSLDQLGFSKRQVNIINKNIVRPHGMFLVTGPTGSGKSTTLYSVLHILNKELVNIITLEDPVEYTMDGINQSQVNPSIKYSFATGLRSILRQDPDVIMVGEIRDGETAELGVHAALTGHFVLSTLHTNDSLGSIPRLLDMKIEPFLLASTLNGIVAQRLVRKICKYCKKEINVSTEVEQEIKETLKNVPLCDFPQGVDVKNDKKLIFYKGEGCSKCGNSGYKGRSVIAEVLDVDEKMANIISDGFKDYDKINKLLEEQKMLTIVQDGYIKALKGVTTVEEVMRVTKD